MAAQDGTRDGSGGSSPQNIRKKPRKPCGSSERQASLGAVPNFSRARRAPLDDVDRAILRILVDNARTPNNALAEAVGIAASTCLARVRTLCERGVIRAFRAEIAPAAIGLPLQAMISVRLRAHTREQNESFRDVAPDLPGVVAVFHMAYPTTTCCTSRSRTPTPCATSW